MANNEHKIFQDIPLKGHDFHSAVIMTYAVDIVNIDSRIRNLLHQKKVCSLTIFADKYQLENSYSYINPITINNLGRDYTITGLESKGAFHPKINMLIGYDSLLCLIGSGNLTVGGHGKNHELFTGFMADNENTAHLPLLQEVWSYIKNKAVLSGEFEKKRILEEIPQNCTLLDDTISFSPHGLVRISDDLEAALIYDDNQQSIFSQITNIVPISKVSKIVVVSPFFDEDGRTITKLHKEFSNADIDIIIQKDSKALPAGLNNDRIKFFDFNKTPRGKKDFKDFQRNMHCKMILFLTDEKEYCFVGSANATEAALGDKIASGRNAEMNVLYASSSINFLSELDLTYSYKANIDIKDISIERTLESHKKQYPIEITGAVINYSDLVINLRNSTSSIPGFIVLDDGYNKKIINDFKIEDNRIVSKKPSINKAANCYLTDENGNRISNIIFVNSISHLNITNPSKNNRELNGVISKITSAGYAGLEIVDILSRVMSEIIEDQKTSISIKNRSNELNNGDQELPDLQYNPEYNRSEDSFLRNIPFEQVGSRLIDSIETCINIKMKALSNEILEEEEEADSETSHSRTEEFNNSTVLSHNDISFYPLQVKSLWQTYDRFLYMREAQSNDKAFKIHHEDICFFTLTLFSSMEICYLNRSQYEFKNLNSLEASNIQKSLFRSFDDIMGINGVNIMKRFGKLIQNHKSAINNDRILFEGQRLIKYMLVFKYLYGRMFTINHFRDIQRAKIDSLLRILLENFGVPDRVKINKELIPIIEKYNHLFEFRHIEYTLDSLVKS